MICGSTHESGAVCLVHDIEHRFHVGSVSGDKHEWPNSAWVEPEPPAESDLNLVDVANKIHASRRTDPTTSAQAGKLQRGTQRALVLAAYVGIDGLTDEQAGDRSGVSHRSSPWKRCSELRDWGWIASTGIERMTVSGSPAMVCAITPEGVAALHAIGV